jgi:hypothetical protein
MNKRIEVTITIGDRKITLEGPEDFVREEVERLAKGPGSNAPADASATVARGDGSVLSERVLVEQKSPHGHNEIVAVLAYALTQGGRPEFTPAEMHRAYIRAGVRPPKVIAQALRDAKNVKDYIEPGQERGTYRLSPHGERTVLFDLPRKKSDSSE